MSGIERAEADTRAIRSGDEAGLRRAAAVVAGWMGTGGGDRLPRFDAELPKLGIGDGGPFLDASVQQAHARAWMYTAAYRRALAEIDASLSRAASGGSEATSTGTQTGAAKGSAADFASWTAQSVRARIGLGRGASLVTSEVPLGALGGSPLLRLLGSIAEHLEGGDPETLAATRRVIGRLDTRIVHRLSLAPLAESMLVDVAFADRLARSGVEAAPTRFPLEEIAVAERAHDAPRLSMIADLETLSPGTRTAAVEALVGIGALRREVANRKLAALADVTPIADLAPNRADRAQGAHDRARNRARETPDRARELTDARARARVHDRARALEALIAALDAERRFDDARAAAGDWATRHRDASWSERATNATALARTLDLAGRREDAYRTIAPFADPSVRDRPPAADPHATRPPLGADTTLGTATGEGGMGDDDARALDAARIEAARALVGLGRLPEAQSMALGRFHRHPSVDTLLLVVETLWRGGGYDAAANALARPPLVLGPRDWQTIGMTFGKVFAARRVADAESAIDALPAGLRTSAVLRALGDGSDAAGGHEVAHVVQSRFDVPGVGGLDLVIGAARSLRRWKGEDAVLGWVRERVPRQLLPFLPPSAFGGHDDRLSWDVVTDPIDDWDGADYLWVVRAASAMRAKDEAHVARARRHFERAADTPYTRIGRYLVDGGDPRILSAGATDARRACEAAFYLGLRAQLDGRVSDAATWFRAALDAGVTSAAEHRWARTALSHTD